MNMLESLERSFHRSKPAFFECDNLRAALAIAKALKWRAAPVIGEFNGTIGVMAIQKPEVV